MVGLKACVALDRLSGHVTTAPLAAIGSPSLVLSGSKIGDTLNSAKVLPFPLLKSYPSHS